MTLQTNKWCSHVMPQCPYACLQAKEPSVTKKYSLIRETFHTIECGYAVMRYGAN